MSGTLAPRRRRCSTTSSASSPAVAALTSEFREGSNAGSETRWSGSIHSDQAGAPGVEEAPFVGRSGIATFEFEACFNFRDLGGYHDGRRPRGPSPGALPVRFAAPTLGTTTSTRFAALRNPRRRRTSGRPRRSPTPAASPITPTACSSTSPAKTRSTITSARAQDLYLRVRAGTRPSSSRTRSTSVAHQDGPIVFHCMAGKDRTGILAALYSFATLGVAGRRHRRPAPR